MRNLFLAMTLAAAPCSAADWVDRAAQPAYRTAETISDDIYGLVNMHFVLPLLPGRLSERVDGGVPSDTSYALFRSEIGQKQERAWRRIEEARPAAPTSSPAALDAWRDRALHEETLAVTDAFAAAMLERYQIQRFGRESGDYASDLGHWDGRFLTSATLLGGAYLYAAGLRAARNAGPVRVELDLRPGRSLRSAFESGEGRGLASLRLSPRGSALALKADWGLRQDRLAAESLGLNYTRRF